MRKATLLAMAAAIVAMFAIPGSASAAWTRHHEANSENVELEVTGTDLKFESSLGGVTCASTISRVLFEGNSTTGTVNTFEPEIQVSVTKNCQGSGAIAGCDVHEVEADSLPWLIYISSKDKVTIKTGTITATLSGFLCPHTAELTPGTATLTVPAGETSTTSTAELSGGGFGVDGDIGVGTATVSGTVHVLGTITFGVGDPGPPPQGWTKDHEFNGFNVEREVTGTDLKFESALGGVTCASTISRVLFEARTTGTVTTFEPETQGSLTENCQGSGAIAGCDVHEASSDALPWVLHTSTSDTVTVTTGTITATLSGFLCPHTAELTPGTATLTVPAGETSTTSTAELSGGGFGVDGDIGVGTATVSGTVHVLGTITYGI